MSSREKMNAALNSIHADFLQYLDKLRAMPDDWINSGVLAVVAIIPCSEAGENEVHYSSNAPTYELTRLLNMMDPGTLQKVNTTKQ